ncbi:SMI1/KNR4 family protein [Streptomyces sp. NPDC050433]|uniref:SMI1/KNR4 family protein n=1 Tax=Streptomyces sp. NPDC050433 TaxID=3365615 RepID=UPI00378BA695
MTDLLLDPGDVNAEGEWALYVYRGWSGEYPDRFESFGAFMRAKYVEFHGDNGADAGFVNETTRALDASLERARLATLAGEDVDRQVEALAEAMRHGRPRARELYVQLTTMLGSSEYFHGPGGLEDPLVGKEFLPVALAQDLHAGKDDPWFLRTLDEGDQDRATALLERIRARTYEYEAPGPFGEAVVAAREQARWGDTEGAWRTVEAALADWEPYGDDHVAPIGLLADPILGPVVTPERGRRVLSTPRGAGLAGRGDSGAGAAGSPDAAVPDGLAWLVDPARNQHSYRFVLAEGLSPTELAGRLGGGSLLPPHSHAETRPWAGITRDAPDRVGFCGPGNEAARDEAPRGLGWSFVFRDGVEPFQPHRVRPMGEKASQGGGRSVLVWCERYETSPVSFHFSYCEDGQERYRFTVSGGTREPSGSGAVPDALDPRLLFPDAGREGDRGGERRALAAISETFGVSLPRFAIQHGRLPAVMTGSWIRPPGRGEARLMFVRHRPSAPESGS